MSGLGVFINAFGAKPSSGDLLVSVFDVVSSSCEFSSPLALWRRVSYGFEVPSAPGFGGVVVVGGFGGDLLDLNVGGCVFSLRFRGTHVLDVVADVDVVRGLLRSAVRLKCLGSNRLVWSGYYPCLSERDNLGGSLFGYRCFRFEFRSVGGDWFLFVDAFSKLITRGSLVDLFGLNLGDYASLLVDSLVVYEFGGVYRVVDVLDVSVSDEIDMGGIKDSVLNYLRRKHGDSVAGRVDPSEPVVVGVGFNNRRYYFAPSLLRLSPSVDNLNRFKRFIGLRSLGSVFRYLRFRDGVSRWDVIKRFIGLISPLDLGGTEFVISNLPVELLL